jgi:hypothetical protein
MKQELKFNVLNLCNSGLRNELNNLVLIDKSCIGGSNSGDIDRFLLSFIDKPIEKNGAYMNEKFHCNAFIVIVRNTAWFREFLDDAYDVMKELEKVSEEELLNF